MSCVTDRTLRLPRAGANDADTHPGKEFAYCQGGAPIRRSSSDGRPSKQQKQKVSYVAEDSPARDNRVNLAPIVPQSPRLATHPFPANGAAPAADQSLCMTNPLIQNRNKQSVSNSNSMSPVNGSVAPLDEEHLLIAMYTKQLAAFEAGELKPMRSLSLLNNYEFLSGSYSTDSLSKKQQVIAQLEARNRELMTEIARIRQEGIGIRRDERALNPTEAMYVSELSALRLRKEELELHLTALQESRKELLIQLEGLMRLLKNHGSLLSSSTPASANSTLTRPDRRDKPYATSTMSSTASAKSDMSGAASDDERSHRQIQTAADAMTNAMSSLVRGLNSEDEAALDAMGLKLSKQLRVLENAKADERQREQEQEIGADDECNLELSIKDKATIDSEAEERVVCLYILCTSECMPPSYVCCAHIAARIPHYSFISIFNFSFYLIFRFQSQPDANAGQVS